MRHHIISIGISKHISKSIHDLEFASKDASDFCDIFVSNINDIGYKKLLIDSEASLSQIKTALGFELENEIKEDDAFFFYFSGHGTNFKDKTGDISNYLVTFDATNDIFNSCLSVTYLLDVFKNLKSKANFIIIDTCFSGSVDLTKGFTTFTAKSESILKTFSNQVSGNGIVVFAACGDDEESLEDPEMKNGLYTKILLDELQINRTGEKFSFVDLYTPISEKVKERALSKYNHTQTPSMSGSIQDVLYLPAFRNKIQVNPDFLEYPRYTEVPEINSQKQEIQIDDSTMQDYLNRTIEFVINERELIDKSPDKYRQISFERFCQNLIIKIKESWEGIYQKSGGVETLSDKIAELEIASIQFTVLGSVLAIYGSDKQMEIYSEHLIQYFDMTKDKQGIVAILSIPEIIIVETIYFIGVLSLANENLKPLKIVLETKIWDNKSSNKKPTDLITKKHIFFSDSFNDRADKVQDHIIKVLSNYSWIDELLPKLKNIEKTNLIIQVNFILVMLGHYKNIRLWHDFARYYAYRLFPLIQRIKYDQDFIKQLYELFNAEQDSVDLLSKFHEYLKVIHKENLGDGYRWQSIEPKDLLIDSENSSN